MTSYLRRWHTTELWGLNRLSVEPALVFHSHQQTASLLSGSETERSSQQAAANDDDDNNMKIKNTTSVWCITCHSTNKKSKCPPILDTTWQSALTGPKLLTICQTLATFQTQKIIDLWPVPNYITELLTYLLFCDITGVKYLSDLLCYRNTRLVTLWTRLSLTKQLNDCSSNHHVIIVLLTARVLDLSNYVSDFLAESLLKRCFNQVNNGHCLCRSSKSSSQFNSYRTPPAQQCTRLSSTVYTDIHSLTLTLWHMPQSVSVLATHFWTVDWDINQ